ncbi:MAG TPA: HAD-IIIA family hydrolase [Patescibacteria group bacterium]|nr:HAD-IIIA family hydrolase [Patescibacteria group bacterium]
MVSKKSPALFLDRDGVLIFDPKYLHKKNQVKILGGVESLINTQKKGFLNVIISNQSVVAKGLLTKDKMWEIDSYIKRLLGKRGVKIAGSYYCPHDPKITGDCVCRKPKSGLLKKAIEKLNIDPEKSFVIGDKLSDLQAAYNAGVRIGILVKRNQDYWDIDSEALKGIEYRADNLEGAIKIIINYLK